MSSVEPEPPGRVRGALARRRRRLRLVSQTGARVVLPSGLDARTLTKAMLPSLFTLANMMCGFVSVMLAFSGYFDTAAVLVGIAVLLDIADGAVARAVGAITPFGLQFDSLADLISFGIAPAVLIHTWGFNASGGWAYAVPIFWLACASFRLARFNVTIDPLADKRYFIGLASPGAAGVVIASVFVLDGPFDGWRVLIPVLVGAIPAALMVSTYRFMSFRTIVAPRGRGVWLSVLALVGLIIGFSLIPAITGMIVAYGYVLVAPLGWATAPARRRVFGADAVAPPRHKLPSVLFPAPDHDEDDLDDEEMQSAELLGEYPEAPREGHRAP